MNLSEEQYNKEIQSFLKLIFDDKKINYTFEDGCYKGGCTYWKPDDYEQWKKIKVWLHEESRKFLFGK